MFKNYKCPNGLPPNECRHLPQIVNNLANYFVKKNEARAELMKQEDRNNIALKASPVDKTRIRTR